MVAERGNPPADTRGAPRVALIAHDARKGDLVEWAALSRGTLSRCELFAAAPIGELIARTARLPITLLRSGPLGGDLPFVPRLLDGHVDLVVFFWDPFTTLPHDVDASALFRLADLSDTPLAYSRSTADLVISSPLFLDWDHLRRRRAARRKEVA